MLVSCKDNGPYLPILFFSELVFKQFYKLWIFLSEESKKCDSFSPKLAPFLLTFNNLLKIGRSFHGSKTNKDSQNNPNNHPIQPIKLEPKDYLGRLGSFKLNKSGALGISKVSTFSFNFEFLFLNRYKLPIWKKVCLVIRIMDLTFHTIFFIKLFLDNFEAMNVLIWVKFRRKLRNVNRFIPSLQRV